MMQPNIEIEFADRAEDAGWMFYVRRDGRTEQTDDICYETPDDAMAAAVAAMQQK